MKDERTAQLGRIHAKKRQSSRSRILRALRLLESRGERITVSSVADVAGVSRATVYNHRDLCSMIEAKRAAQNDQMKRLDNRLRREARRLADLRRKNRRLEEKVRRQSQRMEILADDGPVLPD